MKKYFLLVFFLVLGVSDIEGIHPTLLPTDITYLAIDLKYDEKGNVKILEFQDGPTAGFRAYDEVFEKGEIWKLFWDYMQQFKLPIWYIGPRPFKPRDGVFSHDDRERVAFDYFLGKGGHYVPSLKQLEYDLLFNRVLREKSTKEFKVDRIEDYKGILVIKMCGTSGEIIKQFKKKYPGFLFLNEWSRRHAMNKLATDELFKDKQLALYRPRCKVYKKIYDSSLAQHINDDLKVNLYVIKPVNSSRSNGVIVVDKASLDKTLKKILPVCEKTLSGVYRPSNTMTYGYWKGDKNTQFMVEEYVPSKYIMVNGELYDPTMRAVCIMQNNNGIMTIEVLKAFWKIPRLSLSDQGSLTACHVSKHRNDLELLSPCDLTVAPQDMKQITSELRQAMLKVYGKILSML